MRIIAPSSSVSHLALDVPWHASVSSSLPIPFSLAQSRDVSRLSTAERLQWVVGNAVGKVPSEAKGMLESLCTPENIALMVTSAGVIAGLNLTGFGTVATILAVGGSALATGQRGWNAVCELKQALDLMNGARTPKDLDNAGTHLARAIDYIGAAAVSAFLTHRASAKFVRKALWPGVEPRSAAFRLTDTEPLKSPSLKPDAQNAVQYRSPQPLPAEYKNGLCCTNRPARLVG